MYQPIHFRARHNVAEDLDSTETVSTLGSKSYDTTFSQRNPLLFSHSPYHTTPSHSRSSSQDLDQRHKMDADLIGIGHLAESPTTEDFITAKPSPAEQSPSKQDPSQKDTHIPFDHAVNHHTVSHPPYVSSPSGIFQSNKGDTAMADQDDLIPTPDHSSSSSCSPDLNIIGIGSGLTDCSLRTPSFEEDMSSPYASSADEDLDLEKSADEALSRWFGVSLHRLVRPLRVIYAFEQVKRECAGILQDEGHYQPDADEEEQGSQADPYDAGESSRSTPGSRPWSNRASSYPFGDKRRLRNGMSKSGSSPDSQVKVRGRNKKHPSECEFSCPYRKRNPNRFNIRDHEPCAIKSYSTMSDVKKHLQSHHLRPLICIRCQCSFETGSDLLNHSQQCRDPPQSHTNIQPTDPEDGLDQTMVEQLRSRKNSLKEWRDLYQKLFPDDTNIPDPYFVLVVEDHDVRLSYEQNKQRFYQDIQDLVARQLLDSSASGDRLCEGTMDLFENFISTMFECSKPTHEDLPSQEAQVNPAMQLSESLRDSFIDQTVERNLTTTSMFSSDRSNGTFSTPQYIAPGYQGMSVQDGSQQYLDSSQNMSFPPVYPLPQEMTQTYNHYTGGLAAYYDPTNTMARPWSSVPVRHTTSLPDVLPDDLQAPMTGNIDPNQTFPWTPNDNYPVNPTNYTETCPDPIFYFNDKDQFSTLSTNDMQ
ncbi:hypothetical protein F4818DRAFT_418485 [Hypoxylon cercidicola]|nr:hypothetical protein F4818DRAFT_418485 [Hypoxylon cercidicola]